MRIGIIGSGVAGLSAAYLLAKKHDVTLFEKDERFGGHAHTVGVGTEDGHVVPIDTGFIVHNRRTYPNLIRLFSELGVRTKPSEMSMSVRCDGCRLEYAGARGMRGLLPGISSGSKRDFLRMLLEVRRFHENARRLLDRPEDDTMAIDEFLIEGGYSDFFRAHFLLPLIGAVWSSSQDLANEYPARYLVRFLDNHGMLSMSGSPQWRTVEGGSHSYVDAITRHLDRAHIAAEVVGATRDSTGATVIAAPGNEYRFDHLVIATHPDQALKLLDDPTEDERRVLGAWEYSSNLAVLHTDESLLPRNNGVKGSWNYSTDSCEPDGGVVRITYDLSRLMALQEPRRYLVSLNQLDRINAATVISSETYDHPVYTLESLAAQRELPKLQGANRTWYCGAYHGWGFHEDGCASGVGVARALGVSW